MVTTIAMTPAKVQIMAAVWTPLAMTATQIHRGKTYIEDGKPTVTQGRDGVTEKGNSYEEKDRLVRLVSKYGSTIFVFEDVDTGNDKGCTAKGDR